MEEEIEKPITSEVGMGCKGMEKPLTSEVGKLLDKM